MIQIDHNIWIKSIHAGKNTFVLYIIKTYTSQILCMFSFNCAFDLLPLASIVNDAIIDRCIYATIPYNESKQYNCIWDKVQVATTYTARIRVQR
jgi:hypothetical protein